MVKALSFLCFILTAVSILEHLHKSLNTNTCVNSFARSCGVRVHACQCVSKEGVPFRAIVNERGGGDSFTFSQWKTHLPLLWWWLNLHILLSSILFPMEESLRESLKTQLKALACIQAQRCTHAVQDRQNYVIVPRWSLKHMTDYLFLITSI